ncbi:hypothetical protein [Psychrobacter faecalis]|uniref:hypothetical protein n=1 Tax=Psychrobacter faecalis TaxID=180588 RepID=UPI0028ACCEDD|nr:hypothetical protein [Psychrobacter faecalis]
MSEYQQDAAGWEWMDQEEQHWFANNISEPASNETEKQMMGQLLAQFDSVFGLSEESN